MRTPSIELLSNAEFLTLRDDTDRLLREWAYSSNSAEAMAMKLAVIEEFNLQGLVYNPNRHLIDRRDLARHRRALRYLYERSQSALATVAVSSVRLFRGGTQQIESAGIQSWTESLEVATAFDGLTVLSENVPASAVLAFGGGPLWPRLPLRESEYIVLVGRP